MSAYLSRGAGVLVKIRVEPRLSLPELALILFAATETSDADLSVADIRQAVAALLVCEGTGVVGAARDRIAEAETGEAAGRLAWARRMVAKAYRQDFAKFPAELAAFEAGETT